MIDDAAVDDQNWQICANCGREGNDVNNACNKCKSVMYCNAACKKKHRSRHKKKCERRVAELHEEALFKDPPPPDECPICFLMLPHEGETTFQTCCGKIICNGCICTMISETQAKGESKDKGQSGLYPFCRKPSPTSEKEDMQRLIKLVDSGHAHAMYNYACYIRGGDRQDWVTANRLYLKAGELGCAGAYYNLGTAYERGRGVEVDRQKAKHYYELAAISGYVSARFYVGVLEVEDGSSDRALKHFFIAARAGSKESLEYINKQGYEKGIVTKNGYEKALRSYHKRQNEMKSDERDTLHAVMRSQQATFGSASKNVCKS